jgi:preprotein translocase subunit SecG
MGMSAALIATIVWLVFSLGTASFLRPTTADDHAPIQDNGDDDDYDAEVVDMYERKVSEQGDRFDASNGILVGVLGAQIAVFVFYADVFAKSVATKTDYWFTIVFALLLIGIGIISRTLRAADYRAAPNPDLFAETATKDDTTKREDSPFAT